MKAGDYVCSSQECNTKLPRYYHLEHNLILAASNRVYLIEVEKVEILPDEVLKGYLNQLFRENHLRAYPVHNRINNLNEMIGKIYVRWYDASFLRLANILDIYLPGNIIIKKSLSAELDTNFIHNDREYIITEISCDKKIAYAEEK